MSTPSEIYDIRELIDAIDSSILKLLNVRSSLALKIGSLKKTHNLDIYDPEREKQIIDRLLAENAGPLEGQAIIRLFERIIDESRRLERIRAKGE